MMNIRQGLVTDSANLCELILSSAPVLLPYLFKGEQAVKAFIEQAAQQDNGQFSANMHYVIEPSKNDNSNLQICACMTLWHAQLGDAFQLATLKCLQQYLLESQIQHLLITNPLLSRVFQSPLEHELCVGHLAVHENFKGQGLGKKLIAHAIKQAKILNKSCVILDVDKDNDEALSFYLACGFMLSKDSFFEPTQQTFSRLHYTL